MRNIVCVALIIGASVCASGRELPSETPAIAIWFEGSRSHVRPSGQQLIAAVWGNGDVLWSTNAIYGGAPYQYGKVSVDVGKVLESFKEKGYLADECSQDHFGWDASHTVLAVTAGTNTLCTRSWHETAEQHPNVVAESHGLRSLDGQSREAALKADKAEYQQYRAMWTDIRKQTTLMLPQKGERVDPEEVSYLLEKIRRRF